jgi:hypothetical protein
MVTKISWDEINDLLLYAKRNITLIMPAIHEEWVEVIQENQSIDHLEILICVDNNEEVIRNGYGSEKSMDLLTNMGAKIKQCEGLRICFISIDDNAYCLFIESRIIAGDPDGFNALKLNSEFANDIIMEFFPITEENSIMISAPFDYSTFSEIKKSIEKNPPVEPDLKRQITTYTNLFQFVELRMEGGNFSSKTISIPPGALPFKDEQLKNRLRTRLNLFDKKTSGSWIEWDYLKMKLEDLRRKYLITCSLRKDKSILKREKKEDFKKEIGELRILASETSSKLLQKIQEALDMAPKTLRSELKTFFEINEPDNVKGSSGMDREEKIKMCIDLIIHKIHLPTASSLISKINIEDRYYDLTFEDLNDEKIMEWFLEKKLIKEDDENKIANFRKAFSVKI